MCAHKEAIVVGVWRENDCEISASDLENNINYVKLRFPRGRLQFVRYFWYSQILI